MSDVAWILGQASERKIMVSLWVTETEEHGDVAQVLLSPAGHGVGRQMALLADLAGLNAGDGDDTPVIDPQTCRLEVDPDGVRVVLHGHRLDPSPYRPDWARCARQGPVVLIVGMDPHYGRDTDLDRYLERGRRIRVGLVSAVHY